MTKGVLNVSIPVDHDLADMIVRQWLKRHINYAIHTGETTIHPEDKTAAVEDITAMTHVLAYIGEEE